MEFEVFAVNNPIVESGFLWYRRHLRLNFLLFALLRHGMRFYTGLNCDILGLHSSRHWPNLKVWSWFRLSDRRLWLTLTWINDTIPHTRIDMRYCREQKPLPHSLNKNECCPLSSRCENCHIFLSRTVRKHFQYVCPADCSARQGKDTKTCLHTDENRKNSANSWN